MQMFSTIFMLFLGNYVLFHFSTNVLNASKPVFLAFLLGVAGLSISKEKLGRLQLKFLLHFNLNYWCHFGVSYIGLAVHVEKCV